MSGAVKDAAARATRQQQQQIADVLGNSQA